MLGKRKFQNVRENSHREDKISLGSMAIPKIWPSTILIRDSKVCFAFEELINVFEKSTKVMEIEV